MVERVIEMNWKTILDAGGFTGALTGVGIALVFIVVGVDPGSFAGLFAIFFGMASLSAVIVNQILQGQIPNAVESTGRFAINSTVGIVGLVDVATKMGLEEKDEDFGQTFATWGVGDGFYLVVPIFGPSNVRDATGMLFTYTLDPMNAYFITEGEAWIVPTRMATNAVDYRSKIIDEVNALRTNSLDYYAAVRSSYYQNRKAAIINIDESELTPAPIITVEFE